tara:strand:+ start:214 stop:336 length:123 start_codon:yes stop_codon:yes gene_type:complete
MVPPTRNFFSDKEIINLEIARKLVGIIAQKSLKFIPENLK